MNVEIMELLSSKIDDISLVKKVFNHYDELNLFTKGFLEKNKYDKDIILYIIDHIEYFNNDSQLMITHDYCNFLTLYIDSEKDENVIKIMESNYLKRGNQSLNIIKEYLKYKTDEMAEFLCNYEINRSLSGIFSLMRIYHNSNYDEYIRDNLLLKDNSVFSIDTILNILDLIRQCNEFDNIKKLIIKNANNEYINIIKSYMPLCIKYEKNEDILEIIFNIALDPKNDASFEDIEKIIDFYTCKAYPSYRKKGYFGLLSYFNNLTGVEYFSKQVITSAYKYKTVSEIEQLMIRFYLSPFDYQKILSNESVLKNRTTDEILKILYYRFETINGSELEIFDEIITNDVIEENKSFNEIEQMMDFFNKYDAYYIKEILLNSDLLLTRSIDELEELIKWNCHDQIRSIFKKGLINQVVINKFNNEKLIRLVNLINENPNYEKIVNELITSSNFYEYNSIDEIEWIFKKLNSSNHGKVLEELALSARINGECDLDTLSEIIDTISHSIYYINVLMGNYTFNRQNNPFSKYTGNTILEIIKRIINHECSDDLFNLFDDICLDNYSKEDLSKLMMLYIENDFDENVLKIVTNPLLSIKTPEEIKQLITLASKYLYSERIMGYLEDEDIISIENIDELINVIEYRLKHTHVVKEIETEENIKEYIEYLKEIYGNKEFTIEEKCTLTKNIQDQ